MITKIDRININSIDYDIAVKGENVDGSVAAAATLDNLTATAEELNDANSKKHIHDNKTVLDATTASFTAEEKTKLAGIAEGANNYSLPEGLSTGYVTTGQKSGSTLGEQATAEGSNTEASGSYSHAEGDFTIAGSISSHAEGHYTTANGVNSHAEGSYTTAGGHVSHAEGVSTNRIIDILPDYTLDTDIETIKTAWLSEPFSLAHGNNSHAEGADCLALGLNSHAEGTYTKATGDFSHTEGYGTETSGQYSHAEGEGTIASGQYSHAEGSSTTASGVTSHAEGLYTDATGSYSHAEGYRTTASGYTSHAEGYNTTASNFASHASGKYNKAMTTGGNSSNTTGDAFVIGNGTSSSKLSNAFRVTYTGATYGLSAFNSSGADYAEFVYPWFDDNNDEEDRIGYFVTFKDGKLYKATSKDIILGITSGNPSIVGNADEDYYWRYERDEFNRIVFEDVEEVAEKLDENGMPVRDEDGNIVYEKTGVITKNGRMKLSENYDPSLQNEYVERKDRKEWDYVGMLGVIPTRDDGTCIPGQFCKCNNEGIATFATAEDVAMNRFTFIVLERVSDNVVKVKI